MLASSGHRLSRPGSPSPPPPTPSAPGFVKPPPAARRPSRSSHRPRPTRPPSAAAQHLRPPPRTLEPRQEWPLAGVPPYMMEYKPSYHARLLTTRECKPMLPSSAPRMMEYKPTPRARLLTSWSINRASSSAPYMKEYKPSYHARLPTARLALRPRECAHSTLREPGGSPRVPVALCPAAERGGPERLGSLRGRRQGRTVQAAPLLERGHARRPLRSIPPLSLSTPQRGDSAPGKGT